MFRKLTRYKQELSRDECIDILKHQMRGVLSVQGDNGYPYGLPINHYFNEADGKLYFHSGKSGHKIDAILRDPKASFCIYDEGIRENDNWYLTFSRMPSS